MLASGNGRLVALSPRTLGKANALGQAKYVWSSSCVASSEAGDLQEWVLSGKRLLGKSRPALGALASQTSLDRPYPYRAFEAGKELRPEAEMHYHVPKELWLEPIQNIAAKLTGVKQLPPLIVEWQDRRLTIRDGNHRHAAMVKRAGSLDSPSSGVTVSQSMRLHYCNSPDFCCVQKSG